MVLIDARTRRLAPESVQLGPDGMPPPGYSLSTWYLNDQNFPTTANTNQNLAPLGGVGAPNMTPPAVSRYQQPIPSVGGFEPTGPDWMPDWLNPIPSRQGPIPIPGRPPNITNQNVSEGVPPETKKPGGILPKIKNALTDPEKLVGLAGIITALIGGTKGGGGGTSSESTERLNAITEQRMKRVDPLHQAITQLAWGRLPVNSRQNIAPPTYKPLP